MKRCLGCCWYCVADGGKIRKKPWCRWECEAEAVFGAGCGRWARVDLRVWIAENRA